MRNVYYQAGLRWSIAGFRALRTTLMLSRMKSEARYGLQQAMNEAIANVPPPRELSWRLRYLRHRETESFCNRMPVVVMGALDATCTNRLVMQQTRAMTISSKAAAVVTSNVPSPHFSSTLTLALFPSK